MNTATGPTTRLWPFAVLLLAGCATTTTSNTARTATEQLLITNAVDRALDKVDFSAVQGHQVYLDEKYVDCTDKNYVIASVRHRILKAGGKIAVKPDQADVVLELRTGVVGTNTSEAFVGVPEITLPGMLTLPEVRFAERKMQEGIAKLGIVAYDPASGEVLGSGGMSLAQSNDSNWYMAGMGPIRSGSVRRELEEGTSGQAAIVRDRLPMSVVIAEPSAAPGAEYAADPPAKAVTPAAAEAGPPWWEGK